MRRRPLLSVSESRYLATSGQAPEHYPTHVFRATPQIDRGVEGGQIRGECRMTRHRVIWHSSQKLSWLLWKVLCIGMPRLQHNRAMPVSGTREEKRYILSAVSSLRS